MVARRRSPGTRAPLADSLAAALGTRLRRPARAAGPARSSPEMDGSVVALGPEHTPITAALKAAKLSHRPARPGPMLHVSDVVSKCARLRAICETQDISLPSSPLSLMDDITYRQGDAIHDVIRERVALGSPASVWGRWRCRCGGLRIAEPCVRSEVDLTRLCVYCDTPAQFYDEVSVADEELQLVGHPDLILRMDALRAFYVAELKSISAQQFPELVRPSPEHIVQSLFYWYLMHRAGYPLVDRVSIVYITKGYTFRGDPYREYVVPVENCESRLEEYLSDIRAILRAREGGALPPRIRCASREAPTARACPVVGRCFDDARKPQAMSFASALKKG